MKGIGFNMNWIANLRNNLEMFLVRHRSDIKYGVKLIIFYHLFTWLLITSIIGYIYFNSAELSDDYFEKFKIFSIIVLTIILTLFYFTTRKGNTSSKENDRTDRFISERIGQSEDRLSRQIEESLNRRVADVVDNSLSNSSSAIAKAMLEKLDAQMLETIDSALARRVNKVAAEGRRWRDVLDVFDRLRIRLDGPASRAEQSAMYFRRMAAVLAGAGVCIAAVRVFSTLYYDSLERAVQLTSGDGPSLFALALYSGAPWVGLVLLIEFTALLFQRFYSRSIELQRYFTKELSATELKLVALRVIIDTGTREQIVEACRTLFASETNAWLPVKDGAEQTTAAAGLVKELGGLVGAVSGGTKKKAESE